jgi:hypothetical protein
VFKGDGNYIERMIFMSTKLYQTTNLVKEILENNIQARNSDTYLYLQVIRKVGMLKGIDVNAMSITEFLTKKNALGFPNYETCSRARRKLQAEYVELCGNESVEAQRVVNEREFREFFKK